MEVYLSKHLCGPATDLAVELAQRAHPAALCVATCCHYLITADTYCNTPYLSALGFTETEVAALGLCSQWASLSEEEDAPAERASNYQEEGWKGKPEGECEGKLEGEGGGKREGEGEEQGEGEGMQSSVAAGPSLLTLPRMAKRRLGRQVSMLVPPPPPCGSHR